MISSDSVDDGGLGEDLVIVVGPLAEFEVRDPGN